MPFNVMLEICRVTRASKLFQRNFYLPLLKPLSPKDALRRHIITGKNLLGNRIEHYIPVLEEHSARILRRKYMVKGKGKKRQRKKPNRKYVMPFFDENIENHSKLKRIIDKKSTGRGQCYTYHVPDKDCTLVISHQMERAIRDKDILDVTMAQRSEKIVVKMADGTRVTLPLAVYDGRAPFYRGEGWTKKEIEEFHHHGKETMSLARLFEAKESGVEEWELEMMRLANKRKRKLRGENMPDWKTLMAAAAETMDWEKFEEDARQIVEEVNDPVEDEPIPMEVDDMAKTKNVNEKLKNAGPEVLAKLPLMPEIPELIKILPDGQLTEIADVSGVTITLKGKECFVAGQMVKGDEGDMFMPGQTLETEDGKFEYTPGFTIMMEGEPALLPGLVMGDDVNKPMFLPGESAITETGELQFVETEDDRPREPTPPPPPPPPEPEPEPEPEQEEEELEEEQDSEEEEIEIKPPPKREPQKFHYERPKRQIQQSAGIRRRERHSRKQVVEPAPPPPPQEVKPYVPKKRAVIFDMPPPIVEKSTLEQEKERIKKLTEKKTLEESKIDKKRREILMKARKLIASLPPPKYVPLEPVKKSAKLAEWEDSIKNGNFFVDYKKFLCKERHQKINWLEPYQYKNIFDTVGINRYRVWKSVI